MIVRLQACVRVDVNITGKRDRAFKPFAGAAPFRGGIHSQQLCSLPSGGERFAYGFQCFYEGVEPYSRTDGANILLYFRLSLFPQRIADRHIIQKQA